MTNDMRFNTKGKSFFGLRRRKVHSSTNKAGSRNAHLDATSNSVGEKLSQNENGQNAKLSRIFSFKKMSSTRRKAQDTTADAESDSPSEAGKIVQQGHLGIESEAREVSCSDEASGGEVNEETLRDDDDTIDSLLSSRESLDGSIDGYNGRDRIQRTFALRNKILERLSKVKHPAYLNVLRDNEITVRLNTLNRRRLDRSRESDNDNDEDDDLLDAYRLVDELKAVNKKNWLPKLCGGRFTIECFQGLPAGLLIVVYLIANLHFYNIISTVVWLVDVAMAPYISDAKMDMLWLGAAYIIMRATGYIWLYVDDQSYLAVKFDLHNRARLRYWDARILAYFNQHVKLACLLNLAAFYIVSVVVGEWTEYLCALHITKPMTLWYKDIIAEAYKLAAASPDALSSTIDSLSECEAVATFIEAPIRRLFASYMCRCSDSSFISLPLNIILCVIFGTLQGMLGWSFLESTE